MNIAKILGVAMTLLVLNVHAQKQESLDLKRCHNIINDLFNETELTKEHTAIEYYWGKSCDPNDPEFYWLICDTFQNNYKQHLTQDMYQRMNWSDPHVYTMKTESGRWVMLHWSYPGPDGKYDEIYFEFKFEQEKTQLVAIRKHLSDFWVKEINKPRKTR
jgi:hypothetical protein